MKKACFGILLCCSVYVNGQDTLPAESSHAPLQLEFSGFVLPFESIDVIPIVHAGAGLNIPLKNSGFYIHAAAHTFLFDGRGYGSIGAGIHYGYLNRSFYLSSGVNAGIFSGANDLSEWSPALFPRIELGGKFTNGVILCGGTQLIVAPVRHTQASAFFSPYAKLIVPLKRTVRIKKKPYGYPHYPAGDTILPMKRPFIPKARPPIRQNTLYQGKTYTNNADSLHIQYGLSGFHFTSSRSWKGQSYAQDHWYAAIEVNLPARQKGWYNSFLGAAKFVILENGITSSFYRIGFGRKFEYVHKKLFIGTGLAAGAFYTYQDAFEWKQGYQNSGLSFSAHVEAGLQFRHFAIACGADFYLNAGFNRTPYNHGSFVGADVLSAASPYIKLLFR